MPHASFGQAPAAGTEEEREPITFDFGIYGEDTFTVLSTPTLGDLLDLHEAPEPTPQNELESIEVLVRFLRRLIVPEDRQRFSAALYRIPADRALETVMAAAAYVAEQVSGFPTMPPGSSSAGRSTTGRTSKPKQGGRPRSKR